ncbi:MAG: hypothetical protein OXG64_06715 [Chloroflexi bacterium]|nr:hypothetical protein [Chloroflexota bacterium]MCY3958753.1 hypothetical protein [Chloroflexota bacterium]
MANAEYKALCQTIMAKALGGECWAVALVVRNVFARQVGGEDAQLDLLEELHARTDPTA